MKTNAKSRKILSRPRMTAGGLKSARRERAPMVSLTSKRNPCGMLQAAKQAHDPKAFRDPFRGVCTVLPVLTFRRESL